LHAQRLGLSSREDIVGKTNYDLLPEAEARKHNSINKMVMERRITYSGEETSTMQEGKHSYLSHKAPLFNSSRTKVVGLLGMSIDITDRIRADEERQKTKNLKFQNKLQQVRIQDQEEFRNFIASMAHDIVSPLISLNFIMKTCQDLPEKQRINLRNAITDIGNIANTLLNKYKQNEQHSASMEKQHIFVSLALLETVYQKKREYGDKNIDIRYVPDTSINFTFIEGDQSNFRRMLSNLINNAVEAFEGKPGTVDIDLKVESKKVFIKINDNGRGMSEEMVLKILDNKSIKTTKATGHGLGLNQVRNILDLYKGKMSIDSKKGVGTTITLIFPISETPEWIADRLLLRKGSTVVILDDDKFMYDIWSDLLKNHINDINFKFFSNKNDAADFINFSFEKEKIFLLSDYDLKDKNTGLHFILENNMKEQSMIMTNIHNDKKIHDLIISSGVKILPKQFLNDIPILVK
jgi:signal transduction histidine kinase